MTLMEVLKRFRTLTPPRYRHRERQERQETLPGAERPGWLPPRRLRPRCEVEECNARVAPWRSGSACGLHARCRTHLEAG